MQTLIDLFGIKDLIPHGYCLSWSPVLLWLHVISDLLITLAYYSIPVTLVYFIRQRKDFPYPWLIALFAGFIVACGSTHLLSIITIWLPLYWLDGLIKAFTAIISVISAALMIWVIPRALSLPSAAQLQAEIEHRKTAEAALRQSENKLTTILDSVEACIYIKDDNYQYQYANLQLQKLYGKPLEEIIEKKSDDAFFDAATSAKLRTNDRRVIELGERLATEEVIATKNNPITRTYFSIKQPLYREDGSIYALCGISTDISERKQMEEKLRDSKTFIVSILNSLTSHIAVLDEQGVIVAVNNAWRQFAYANGLLEPNQNMLGFSYLDACKNAFNNPYGNQANAAYTGINSVLTGGKETFQLEYPCHSPNQQRWFHMNVSPLQGLRRGVVVSHENISARKRAERVLIQLKAMIDIAIDGFWIVDLKGNLLQANEAYARISGYPIAELVNMNISQLEAMEGSEQIKTHIEKVITQGGYGLFETRHRHKDGHVIDIEISVAFLPEFQQFCVFCRDITGRKAMEEELKASEAKFRSIIEASPVPMMVLNAEQLSLTFLNPAFVKTFGYNLDDIPTLADWWSKAYRDPAYRHWVQSNWQMAMEKAKQEQTEIPPLERVIRCKNNSDRTLMVSAAAVANSLGIWLVMLYDITERKQTEAKLNAIFNASVEGIITVDMSDIIVSVNAAVELIFGYKPAELIGCNVSKLMTFTPSSPREMNACSLLRAVRCIGQIQEIEGLHKNGSVMPLELSIAEYAIEDAHFFTYIVRDVSLRKQQQQQDKEHLNQLAHVTRLGLMGEMASGIAHEVNQPLAAISAYSQASLNLINTASPDLPKLTEIVGKTKQQALRAGQIIHRMREFGRSHSKHRSTVDINTLIHDAVALCSAELKQNNVTLTFELENNLPPLYVDHVQIEQVVINLIRNSVDALQALPANQQRQLNIHTCMTSDDAVQVNIKDNGPGLNEDQKKNILMPFYTTKADGMGMGLSISRSLIQAHEGTLQFNSQLGKGTRFYFTLPIQAKSDTH